MANWTVLLRRIKDLNALNQVVLFSYFFLGIRGERQVSYEHLRRFSPQSICFLASGQYFHDFHSSFNSRVFWKLSSLYRDK